MDPVIQPNIKISMIDPTSALLNRQSNTRSLEFIRRALVSHLSLLKMAESSRMLTVLEPINFQEEYQYIEQLIHDITFVLNNRQI